MSAYFKAVKSLGMEVETTKCFICNTPIVINAVDKHLINDIVCCDCIDYAKDHWS